MKRSARLAVNINSGWLLLALAALLAARAEGQANIGGIAARAFPVAATVAQLPAAGSGDHGLRRVTDGASATDCTVGGGSTILLCLDTGAAWIAVGGSGAATDVSCTDCVTLGAETTGGYAASVSEGGPATTATALAANGANCSAGSYPLGVDASGAVEGCTADDTGTDDQTAAEVPVTDAGAYFTGTDVEAALAEIGAGTTLDGRYVNEGASAGGDLTGTYPSPTVAAGAVGLGELADDLGCTASQDVRRNSGDTGWECYTPAAGSGDVVGPASSTDNAIARYDLTTGKLLKNSGVTIDNSNHIDAPGGISFGNPGSSSYPQLRASGNELTIGARRLFAYEFWSCPDPDCAGGGGNANWIFGAGRIAPQGTFNAPFYISGAGTGGVSFGDSGGAQYIRQPRSATAPVTCGSANTDAIEYFDTSSATLCSCDGTNWHNLYDPSDPTPNTTCS